MTTLLIAGAAGAVGSRCLSVALDDPRVDQVVAPTRRPLEPRPHLSNTVLNFYDMPQDRDLWTADAVICALGTTHRDAGSKGAFRRVDHDLPVEIAQLARSNGASAFAFTSSTGADPASRSFYLRVKGETEVDLKICGYPSLSIIRPAGIIGTGRQSRLSFNQVGVLTSRVLSPVLPARLAPVHVGRVACKLVNSVLAEPPGFNVFESETL